MERTKRKCPSESFQVEKVICSYSKSKKLKFDESSKQKSELIIVKVEPLAFLKNEDEEDWSKCPKDDFPIVEESNKCPKCSISYKSKASMKNHIQVCKSEDQNQEDKNFERSETVSVISTYQNGIRKTEEHEKNSIKILEQSCFGNIIEIEDELQKRRSLPDDVTFQCRECDQIFSMCSGCGREYSNKKNFDAHLLTSGCSGDLKLIYPCAICRKIFTRKDNLREHLRAHIIQEKNKEPKKKRDYKCNFCLKSFGGSSLLAIHIKSHNSKKPYGCPDCLLNFSDRGSFRIHLREQHKTSSKRLKNTKSKTDTFQIAVTVESSPFNLIECLNEQFKPQQNEVVIKEETVKVKLETVNKVTTKPLLLPPGFKPVTLNKNGLISGLQSDESRFFFVKKEEDDDLDSSEVHSIVIKEEPLL